MRRIRTIDEFPFASFYLGNQPTRIWMSVAVLLMLNAIQIKIIVMQSVNDILSRMTQRIRSVALIIGHSIRVPRFSKGNAPNRDVLVEGFQVVLKRKV